MRVSVRGRSYTSRMKRRHFLTLSSGMVATMALNSCGFAKATGHIDTTWYQRSRKFADLPMSRVAYVEHGHGPAALFVHGYPLNGYQWRGALERLHNHRTCIAPDMMSLGYTEVPAGQPIT